MTTLSRHGWQGETGLLSYRELQFTLAVADGLTDKQIAKEAGLAPDSVRKRIASAMFKLGAHRRAHLIAEAMRRAIIAPLVVSLSVCIVAVNSNPDHYQERAPRHRTTRHSRRDTDLVSSMEYI